jgi:dienelactone hydrolase
MLAAVLLLPSYLAAQGSPEETAPEEAAPSPRQIRTAVERALPLLERASAGSANQRTCFTCHSQALPVLAIVESTQHGFSANAENLKRQIEHTHSHLLRGRKAYEEGSGQGGGVDTAGYALWTLEKGGWPHDDVTATVTQWLLTKQNQDGYWSHSSNRPPSEASDMTTTYLALRALAAFGAETQREAIERATTAASRWLAQADAKDTEDQVFRLLSLGYSDLPPEVSLAAIARLKQAQRDDGGWSQKDDLASDAYATATVIYALHRAGAVDTDSVEWTRAVRFLLAQQLEDGSWHVKSRSKPFQTYFESGFPHGKDQFISTTATGWATVVLMQSLPEQQAPTIETLAGTRPLDWPEADLSQRLMQVAHGFVEGQIDAAARNRQAVRGDSEAADVSRRELQSILGVVENRLPPRMEYFGDEQNPAVIAETDAYQVFQVRWPVLADVMGEGLLIKQREKPIGRVVVVPDADQSPEATLGWQSADASSENSLPPPLARQLADNRFDVVIPAIVSRAKMQTGDRRLQQADYTEREWIYRQAFHMGRHVIGYDIQRVLAAVDWFAAHQTDTLKIGIAGYGEGGLIALHAAAIDTRIDASLVAGYFDRSDRVWNEPIYRNVWSRLKHFGNAEVASLILPRELVIEHCTLPAVTGHKGELTTPTFEAVKSEFEKIPDRGDYCTLIAGPNGQTVGPWSIDAVTQFARHLGLENLKPTGDQRLVDRRAAADQWIRERNERTTDQLEKHVQSLVRASEQVRDDFFLYQVMPAFADSRWSTERRHPTVGAEKFMAAAKSYRTQFQEQAMGRFDAELLPPNARTRKVVATDSWTAYDVVLDVHDGLFSWGMLVVPNDLEPGERRPVVVCQHGRNGVPRDTVDAGTTAYNDFAAQLAERGFITFAPHNLYRGEDQYRWLDRKANTIGCTLFSFIIAQHDATLRWLDSLPFVDGNRIAFYGLSYGGESAVRVPAALERYCLSICSGDFNQWTRKVAATDQPFSFMNTIEWEMPYWNLGHTFDYAEMAYLIFPRPFMVERGHHDRVGRDQWVAHEFAKVRWLYAQFGMADRTEIEFFQGGHSINGEGTFDFLHKHLRWPLPHAADAVER